MFPEFKFADKDIKKRYTDFYGEEEAFADGRIPYWREKLSNLSEFMREIKVDFGWNVFIKKAVGIKLSIIRKTGFSLEEIRVTSGSNKAQLTTFYSIDQQPIGFNMTLPAVL